MIMASIISVPRLVFLMALLFTAAAVLAACVDVGDAVIASVGKVTSKEFYSSGGFRDYTDYAKYTFEDAKMENNPYFSPMTENTAGALNMYLNDFEEWVRVVSENEPDGGLSAKYDFDRDLITEDDYVYINSTVTRTPMYTSFDRYDIYFFDSETGVLYFFHNNT